MPVVTYVDPDTVHNPASGTAAPATWFTTLEADFRSIVGRVAARIYNDTTEDYPAAPSTTTVALPDTDFNNGMTLSTANTIIVPSSYGGKYLLNAGGRFFNVNVSTATATLEIRVNGTAVFAEKIFFNSSTNFYSSISASTVQSLAVSDAVTLAVTNSGSTDTDSEVTGFYPSLSAFWLSA